LFTPDFASVGLVNLDDEHGRRLLAAPQIRLNSFSAEGNPAADWRATAVVSGPTGSRFVAHGPRVQVDVTTNLPGHFNIANALAALAMLVTGGVDPSTAVSGIARLRGVPGRMEPVEAGQPFTALVDYAHTPQAVVTLLETLRATMTAPVTSTARSTRPPRLLVVLGCGGDRDAAKRPLMGAAAARLADVAVLTSDNPRSESPERILDAVVAGAREVPSTERGEVMRELDRATAIGIAVARAEPGDVVVIAGKGHEQGQEVAGVVHPFDDRVVLRQQLAKIGWTA
jgi:UDP-N-acetylmuramoyl-L-alanyl-D-glutamate--2,6-diaminopimelate ligase